MLCASPQLEPWFLATKPGNQTQRSKGKSVKNKFRAGDMKRTGSKQETDQIRDQHDKDKTKPAKLRAQAEDQHKFRNKVQQKTNKSQTKQNKMTSLKTAQFIVK